MATLELPIDPNSATAAPAGVRVLVVDDDARMRRIVTNAIQRIGFHVLSCDDGAAAIALAEHTPVDLALVDLHMPTPGTDVVRRLKAMQGAAVWIAILTGQDDEETRQGCFAAGADDVLAKPVMLAELKRRVIAAARTQQAFVEARLGREQTDRRLAYGAEAAAMLAHDLNNGLAVALSNMTYLHGVVQLGEDETSALVSTMNALRRMSGLVANFVDIARFEDAAVKPHVTSNNVHAMLQEVIEVHSALPEKEIQYVIECDPSLLGWFDLPLVERVLHNLVGNATRYCSRGGTIKVSGRRTEDSDNRGTELVISNTGPHVPANMRDKLFTKYAKGNGGKRGFGLYFCRLACDAHGGSIEYRPLENASAFVVRLPGSV